MIKKLKSLLGIKPKQYNLLYRNAKGKTRLFLIGDPLKKTTFGNGGEDDSNVGFRARVGNRDGAIRSFRYDRIVSLSS